LECRPSQSLHAVRVEDGGMVSGIESVSDSDYWINAGFFCLRREIFDHIRDGEELVEAPFRRLIEQRKLWSHRHPGFWAAMDTFKDKITLDRMEARGRCPWMVWKQAGSAASTWLGLSPSSWLPLRGTEM
jgi:glucose-1-phosphate cytidylyltransferase